MSVTFYEHENDRLALEVAWTEPPPEAAEIAILAEGETAASVAPGGWRATPYWFRAERVETDADRLRLVFPIALWACVEHDDRRLTLVVRAPDRGTLLTTPFRWGDHDVRGLLPPGERSAPTAAAPAAAKVLRPPLRDLTVRTRCDQAMTIDIRHRNPQRPDFVPRLLWVEGEGGSVTVNGDGTLTYRPAAGFVGTDRFTYGLGAAAGLGERAAITVEVGALARDEIARRAAAASIAAVEQLHARRDRSRGARAIGLVALVLVALGGAGLIGRFGWDEVGRVVAETLRPLEQRVRAAAAALVATTPGPDTAPAPETATEPPAAVAPPEEAPDEPGDAGGDA